MNDLYNRMKEIEAKYLQPQSFKQYKNYWLPESIVKESKNVVSYGVHRDVGWEQAMCIDNQNLNIHCYDPTPDSVNLFATNFNYKDKMTFHNKAYAKENGKMKFYFDSKDLTKCYSLLPLPQFGENPQYIEVDTINLEKSLDDVNGKVDIIKADLVEFEVKLIDNETSITQYEDLLKEFKDKGYKLYLNRPRNKILSEAVILR